MGSIVFCSQVRRARLCSFMHLRILCCFCIHCMLCFDSVTSLHSLSNQSDLVLFRWTLEVFVVQVMANIQYTDTARGEERTYLMKSICQLWPTHTSSPNKNWFKARALYLKMACSHLCLSTQYYIVLVQTNTEILNGIQWWLNQSAQRPRLRWRHLPYMAHTLLVNNSLTSIPIHLNRNYVDQSCSLPALT